MELSAQVKLHGFSFKSKVDGRYRKSKFPEFNLVVTVNAQPPDDGVYLWLGDFFVVIFRKLFRFMKSR
jgi:hypothetical protein